MVNNSGAAIYTAVYREQPSLKSKKYLFIGGNVARGEQSKRKV